MSETKWTMGECGEDRVYIWHDDCIVAEVLSEDVGYAAMDANARLIAAARELLEACKALVAREFAGHNATCVCCRQTRSKGHAPLCQWVQAVKIIAKTEGEL
jgi:hypothetical protein